MELFNLISLCLQVTFDDFEMVKVLGRGTFGKVVVALEKAAQKVVAIKILKKDVIIAKVSVSVCWFEVCISVCSEVSMMSLTLLHVDSWRFFYWTDTDTSSLQTLVFVKKTSRKAQRPAPSVEHQNI